MTAATALINRLFTLLFDALVFPLRALPPIWALLFLSAVSGVALVWLFGLVSNQDVIRIIRDRIRGNLLAVRLFQHDLGVVMRVQGRIMADTMRYMGHAFLPMLTLMVPFVFVVIQLDLRFERRPLRAGEEVVVKAVFAEGTDLMAEPVGLSVTDEAGGVPEGGVEGGVEIRTPAVRVPESGEVLWRVRAGDKAGTYALKVARGADTLEKEIVIGDGWANVSARRTGAGVLETLLHPGESPIPSGSALRFVAIDYPNQQSPVFGWNIHWLITFLVFSIAVGFALKDKLGVEI